MHKENRDFSFNTGNIPAEQAVQQDYFYKKYGTIVKLAGLLGGGDFVFIYDPDAVEKVITMFVTVISAAQMISNVMKLANTFYVRSKCWQAGYLVRLVVLCC
jgi:hypothetical protein